MELYLIRHGRQSSRLCNVNVDLSPEGRRQAALYTDAIRAQVLEYRGYRTQILEFIDMEHTPKNILIRAVRQGNDAAFKKAREKTGTELRKLLEFLQADPAIVRLLAPELGTGERAGTDE